MIFLVEFFKCWKYPSNSSETFKILFFHQNNQFEAKTACFADFSILTKIAVSGPYRRGHFVGWFFWLSFSNVENTLRILLKHSKFCSFIKTISLKQKQHVLRTFQFWPKSLYPDLTGVAIFLVDFLKMLKIPFEFFWNIQNFVLSSKQSVWSKNSMFCGLFNFDQNRCIRTLPAWPFCCDFLSFSNVENTLRILLKHSKCCSFIKTISMFCGLFNFDQNRCIRTLPAWPFCWLIFLVEFFVENTLRNVENTLRILLKHSKCLFFHQNNQFEAKTACFADFSILTKIAVSGPYRRGHFVSWFFWLIFLVDFLKCWKYPSNSSETFKILFFHQNNQFEAKTACFAEIFNFDQNRCIRTLPAWPFWPKLYPLIFLVEFFKCWKYPSNSSETFKILFFHQNNQFEAKTACFADFSILTKIAVSGPYRRGHFVGWFFWLSFSNVENTLRILLKHSKFCSFIKTISLKQKQHVLRTFQFWPKSLYPDLTGVAIFLVDFLKCWKYPSNSSETFKMLFFHQNNQFEAKTACFADFSILTKIAVSGPYRRGHFFKMLKIPFEFFWNIQNFVLSSKQSVWSKNSMFCGLFNFDQNRCIRTLPAWPFFWLIFWNVENTLPILLKHSKFCSFIKTISLKQKQHVLRTFQFWPKSLYPDLTGVAILLVDFFGWVFQMLKIPFEFFWNIQNFVLSSKQSVWSKNSMFCGLFNFDQNRCIRTLPAWPFFLVDFLKCWKYPSNSSETFKILFFHQNNQFEAKTACFADFSILTKIAVSGPYRRGHFVSWFFWLSFFECWKYPSNSSETFKILFFHQNNQFEAKTACFADFSILTKIAVSGPYRRGHFVGWFFWLSFSNVENTLRILLKHSKFCSFIKTISLKQKQHVLRTFQFWPKSLYPDLTGVAILLVDFFGWVFQMLKIPFEFFWNIQNFVLSSKQSVWSKNSMFCGLFNFDQNRCIRTLPAWPFCWLIFLVEFFKCWKYPSNSSETFKILFFHQNNQFEAKTACFADFSILTKIAVSGPYRRGHFVGWFFWLSFSNVENTLRILLKHSKFCSFIKTISLKQKQHVLRTFQFWPKSLYPDLTGVAILLVDFFGWFFQMLKIPFQFFWNIQNVVLSSKQSVWSKNSMFCGLFNFDQNRCIRTLPAWPFCWLIFLVEFFKCWKYPSNSSETFKILFFHQNNQFEAKTACFADFSILTKIAVSGPYRRGHFVGWFFWLSFSNVENTLRILLKHSKFCSFIKTISLKQKQHVLRTFQFWPKSLYPDLTGVAILFGWFFEMLKIPFEFFWNIQNFVLSSKQSVWSKNSMFCGLFNFDQNRCIRTLPAWPFCWLIFLVEFFKCWKYPSNSSETFKILFFHQNNQFEAKTACFADFSILTKIAVSGPYRRGHFVGWFFWLSFSNVENTLRILLKHSKFCSFIKTISLKQKQHVLRTFQFWPKSLYPDLTGVAIFLVDFLKCWKYPSNSSETFKILFFHQNNQFEAKTACFADFSILTKIAVSGPYRRGHFVGWFFWLSFSNVENTLRILLKHSKFCSFIKTISLKQKQHVLRTFQFWPKSLYPDLTGVLVGWFFWLSFSNVENTLRILLKHSKFCSFIKTISLKQKQHFCGLFKFWNVYPENTLRILLKHSKFCSFIKTISLKQKQHVLRTFQFWPKSLYPDLTGVAILLVDFFGWVFQMLKIPFEFFWNIQNFVLSSKQSVWSKNSMFCGLFNFDQNRCIRTLPAWPFCWLIFLVEFFKCWKYPSNSSETFKILFFHQNNQFEAKTACFADFSILTKIAVSGPYRRGHFVGWFFWLSFSNVENTLRILLKHSKFCSFIKTISLKQKQHVLRTFQFWPKSLYPDLTGVAIFLVDFWNVENTLRILLKHSKFCSFIKTISLKQKQHVLRTFQFWPKSLYPDLTGVAILLVDWLIFLVEFLKCWKYPSNSSETFKILFFHQNNQFEAKTACFADFSILTKIAVSGPYRRGHFVGWFFWLSFSNVENTLRILLKHSKFCSFIKTISLKQKQHVLRTFQFWPKSLYPDLTGVAILLVDFLKCWKYPSNSSETFKILFFHQNNQFEAKTACFADFSILTKIAVSGPYRRGHFVGWFFWLIFWNVENTLQFFWNIQNQCSFIKTISMFCGLFNFDQNRCIRTLPAWPFCWLIFLVEFFKCWKYPSNSSETFKILFFHQNNQFEAKTACFADFSILTKIAVSGPYRRGHFVSWFFWLIFLVDFLKCWKYPSNSSETFKILFFHQNNQFEDKNSMFCGLFNFDQNRCIRTLPAWPFCWFFFGWFFEMLKIPFQFFWNIQNVVLSSKQSVWSKNSMFCGLFNFDQNRCIRTLPAWPFCWLIFLVEFFKCWKYPSNSSETFKILFFHQNNQFEAKTACFADFSILTKIAVSGPYRRGHFVSWLIFWNVENFQFFWNIQNVVLSSKQFWSKNSMFCGNFDQNRCIRKIFWNVENTLPILLKHSKFCSFIKTISLKQKQHVLRTFQFWPKSLYPDLTGVAIFWLIFWNVENTLPILLKHSKCCSFIKTISLKQKQHVLRTFQFWPKSLYPDLTGVAILLVDFFGWVFQMLKIPFEFFWNIQNFVLSSKQSVWSKNSMFCGLFNFDQNRCIRTLPAWPFFWLIFWNVENTLPILLKHSKFCSFIKTISLKQKQHVLRTFQFWPKSLYPDLTGVAILLIFLVDFLVENVENTLRILLKHSKFCSFIKTISLKQKQHVLRTFQFWPKSLYPDLTGVAILLVDFFGWVFQMLKIPFEFFWNIQNFVLSSKQSVWSKNSMFCGLFNFDQNRCIRTLPAWPFCWLIFLVEFFKCWKYPSNSSETFKILFFHQNNQFEAKTACFADFSILTKIAVSGPYRRGHFVGWFFWLIFWNVENTLPILLKHSKFCSFIKTISLKQKQHVLRTFQFWPKSLYPDLTGVAILLVDFFGWVFQMLKIPFEFFWNIQNFVLSSKQSVWSKNSMFCGLFNFDQNRCIRTLPAWPFFWLIFWNVENTLPILLKHSKCCSFIKTISLKQKQHVLRTFQFWPKSLYPDLTGVAILLVDFFGWVFQMLKIPFEFFWNIQNFVLSSKQSVWSKNSMFCGLFNFDQNRCIRTLPAWPFCWLIFLVEFFKCWKYPSNSSETFKILFFHQNNQFEAKTACFADFSILTKIAVSGPYRRGHFFGWFFEMLKIPFQFFWNIQNVVLSSKQSVWSKNSMFCGLFNFDQNRCIRTLPAWPFCWLIFLVEFFKCWKYPSNSSETFKILFFHQNNQFEAKTACFADFSILTKIAVSGPYRRGHFVWFFWLIFWNVENTLPILLKHSKCCSFIKTISLKQKQHVLRTFQFWPKSLYPDLTGVAILLVDFFGWFFEMLKIPFQFFWNIQNFVLSSKQSVWSKNSMFCGLFNFDQNRCIRTLPAWPFCWLIFLVEFFKCWKYPSNSSETFKILFFHQNNQFEAKTACFADFSILTKIAVSGPYRRGHFLVEFLKCWKYPSNSSETFKFCSFIKTIISSMFCGLFKFDQNRCIRTLPAWPFFWLIFWNVENTLRILLKHSKFCSFIKTISLKQKQHVLRTFQFWPKSLYPDLTGVAIFLVDFLVEFFEMLKIPFEFFWNIQNFVLSSKQSVWSKNSMFCGLFNFDQNRCIRTLPAWPFCWLIFLVEFFKCWKYPSNSSETFKILFFHQNNQFEAKTACFADFSILTKIAVSGPYRRGHFVGWFFWLIFWNVENTLRILLKHSKFCSFIKTISLKQKQHVLRTFQFWPKSLYPDLTGVAIFLVDFFWNVENTLPILLKHSKFCSFIKTISLKQKQHVLRTFQFWPKSLYPDLTGVAILLVDFFENVENTLPILLKHSKFCSFIKTISLKQKQHVLRTFQFWPKSLYPDLTGVAILLVDFFGWFFQMLKIPFEFFWNIQNFVLSSKQSVWSKNSMFCGLFNFDQNRCIRTLPAWPFFWLIFWNVENTLEFSEMLFFQNTVWSFELLLKHSKFCSFIKTIQFEAKTACFADFSILTKIAVSGPYRRGHFVGWFFWLSFSNVENTLRILLKHSKFCSFIKTISLKQKQHVLRTFQFWPKSLYPDLTGVAILLVDFFGWVFQMLKIPFEFFWNIQNFVLSSKQSVWSKNSMFCGLFNFDQNRCIRTLPAWPFFWLLIFLVENVENTLPILLKHSKFCSFIKTISLKQKQHVLRTFQFWPKSLYPDLTGVAILLVDFFGWVFQMLKIPFEFFWNIQNFVLSSKQSVWSKNSMFCGLFNFDQNRCIRTLPAWPFCWLIFLENWVFQMLKIPFEFFWNIQNFVLSSKQSVWSKNSMFCGLFNFDQNRCIRTLPAWPFFCWFFEMLKIPFQFFWNIQNVVLSSKQSAKTACFADFSILTKIAVSGPYRRGHFVGWFFWLSFSNVENTLRILLKHSKFCSFIKTISLKQKQHVLRTFQFWQNRCIRTLPRGHFVGWFFWLIFWNVENTLPILLKHSKFCSFIKTISLKQKQHVLRTFQFWPKSLYPDLTAWPFC